MVVSLPKLCSIFGRPRQGWSLPSQNVVNRKWQDDSGAVLESLVNSDAVLTAFAKQVSEVHTVQSTCKKTKFREILQDDLPTGHCIALVEGAERTLAANLGAANKFSAEDLWQGNNRTLLEGAKVKHPSFHEVCLIIFP